MYDDIGDLRLQLADVVLQAARHLMRGGKSAVLTGRHRDEHHESAVCVEQAEVPGWGSCPLLHEPLDPLALSLVGACGFLLRDKRALERLEVRVDVLHAGFGAEGGFHALSDLVSLSERNVGIHLEVE